MNKVIIGVAVAVVVLIGAARYMSDPAEQRAASAGVEGENDIISTNGIHWHPTLTIFVRGEEVEVPANIGLIGGHNPMHTHDPDGVIHLEFDSIVRLSDITLGRFFELWGREFSENQLFEHTNTDTERVRMFVNNKENFEFGGYVLRHEDEIVIRYE